MIWTINIKRRVAKQLVLLPLDVRQAFMTLMASLELNGAYQPNWSHFGKLSEKRFHCHIKKGHPTYVVIWEVIDKHNKIIEVQYAGTHEKAPY